VGRPGAAAAQAIRIAFVGKPNVGKSSLVNRLLGEERVLVHDQPGTTRDPIDTPFTCDGHDYVLVDTAGLRRRRSIETLTEHVAAKMARDQLERCDVAALVIDAREGATAEDARLAGLIEQSGRAALLVLNKKDLVSRAQIDAKIEATREQLAFMRYAPVLLTSAATGAGVSALPAAALQAFGEASRRVPTAELNKLLEEILAHQPPPSGPSGRHVRLYYVTQPGVRPPTFYVSTNQPAAIGFAYRRFLVNRLRKAYGFEGTPIRVVLRAHRQKRKGMPRTED
jgi:GTP-binding protein